jgi:hypothetical protein
MSETSKSAIREPRELVQPERNACLSCVATNILFSHGLVEIDWEVKDTDRLISRNKGETADWTKVDLMLLRKGFRLSFVNNFSTDGFIEGGLDYLRQYYGDSWPEPDFSAYWTPVKLAERIAERKKEKARYAPFNNSFTDVARIPALEDVIDHIDDGQQVVLQLNGSSSSVTHSVLFYGLEGINFNTYFPNLADGGIGHIPQQDLEYFWRPEDGMTAVKL